MKLKTLLVALPIAVLALLGAGAQGHAAVGQPTSAPAPVVLSDDPPSVSVTVHTDNGANGVQVANAISGIREKSRDKFVQRAVDTAFSASGSRFNVIIMNLSQGYTHNLQGIRLYANIRYGQINYGMWIAEAGSFTNTGDGGWENWGFRGWFTRNGMTVNFRRP
ncbi:hypothetical protein ACWEIJ_11045 [Lentzea sp. NPDC004789]